MKKATILIAAALFTLASGAWARGGGGHSSGGSHASAASGGSHSVRGHVTKNGTYVAPHHATNPDGRKSNNWSQKGNVNPYTGKEGTKKD
jgi:hypothetical protein